MPTLEQQVADLVTATTQLTTEVQGQKQTIDTKVNQVSSDRSVAEQKAAEAAQSATDAANSAAAAAQSEANAAAVVTGGTATFTPAPGKIPLADANGEIAYWLQKGLLGNVHSPLVDLPLNQIELLPFATVKVASAIPAATDVTPDWVGLLRTVTISFAAIPDGVQAGQYALINGDEYPIVAVDTVNNTITLEYDLGHADPTGTPVVTFAMWRFAGRYRGLSSFSRASRKTYIDPLTGLVRGCPAGFPAFERMVDGAVGYLTEGAGTNYATGGHTATGVNVTGVSPSGATEMLFNWNVAGGATGYLNLFSTNTFAAGPLTIGIWLKSADGTNYQVKFVGHDGVAWTNPITVTVTNQWKFFTYTITAQNSSAYFLLEGSTVYGLPAAVNILLWRWNIEALPYSTSLMPYNSTRTQDLLMLPAALNIPPLQRDMFVVCDVDVHGSSTYHVPISADISHHFLAIDPTDKVYAYNGTGGAALVYGPVNIQQNAVNRIAHLVNANGAQHAVSVNGQLGPASATSAGIGGPLTTLYIGSWTNSGGSHHYGHIRNVRIYDRSLTASEVAAA